VRRDHFEGLQNPFLNLNTSNENKNITIRNIEKHTHADGIYETGQLRTRKMFGAIVSHHSPLHHRIMLRCLFEININTTLPRFSFDIIFPPRWRIFYILHSQRASCFLGFFLTT